MEITLATNRVACYERIGKGAMVSEETAECVVSDLLPDIAGILDADGWIAIQTKSADLGKISVTASITATVLYQPEDGSPIRRLGVNIPYSAAFEIPEADEQCVPVVNLEIDSMDARILNPRKVLVRVSVRASADCYRSGELALPHAIPETAPGGIRTLDATCAFTRVTGVREKTFVVSDESQIPAALPPIGELLKSRMEAIVEDVKPVGNKLVFKGSVHTTFLYAAMDSGELCVHACTTAFSQIIEMDTIAEYPLADITLMATALYTELLDNAGDRRHMGLELHFVAQVVCREAAQLSYIEDAYDPAHPLSLQTETKLFRTCLRQVTLRESVRELVETQTGVEEVLHVYALPGVATVEGGTVQCPLNVQLLYRNESGAVCRTSARYMVQSSQELEEEAGLTIRTVHCEEAYAAPAAGGIELRIPVELFGEVSLERTVTAVTEISVDEAQEEAQQEHPSLYLLYADASDTVWKLAKRYGSTPELIRAANGMEAEEEPEQALLLIPRIGL